MEIRCKKGTNNPNQRREECPPRLYGQQKRQAYGDRLKYWNEWHTTPRTINGWTHTKSERAH